MLLERALWRQNDATAMVTYGFAAGTALVAPKRRHSEGFVRTCCKNAPCGAGVAPQRGLRTESLLELPLWRLKDATVGVPSRRRTPFFLVEAPSPSLLGEYRFFLTEKDVCPVEPRHFSEIAIFSAVRRWRWRRGRRCGAIGAAAGRRSRCRRPRDRRPVPPRARRHRGPVTASQKNRTSRLQSFLNC